MLSWMSGSSTQVLLAVIASAAAARRWRRRRGVSEGWRNDECLLDGNHQFVAVNKSQWNDSKVPNDVVTLFSLLFTTNINGQGQRLEPQARRYPWGYLGVVVFSHNHQ